MQVLALPLSTSCGEMFSRAGLVSFLTPFRCSENLAVCPAQELFQRFLQFAYASREGADPYWSDSCECFELYRL
jgi:hypothetical protein